MNKVVHFELPVSDMEKAKDFYAKTFDWKCKPWDENYSIIEISQSDERGHSNEVGSINGGLQRRSERAKSPTVVIQVDSLDEAIEKIKMNGGKIIVQKESLGDEGLYAQFDDPEGNRMGLFEEK